MNKHFIMLKEHAEASAKIRKIRSQYREAVGKSSITYDQYIMLEVLHGMQRKGTCTQLELAEAVGKDKPTVSRMVELVSNRGLIERHEDSRDRRRKVIALTDSGRVVLDDIRKLING